MTITWNKLEAECKSFRNGFVAVFLKHRGEFIVDNDGEHLRDGQGRRIKVTQRNFAERFGIHEATLRRWIRGDLARHSDAPAPKRSSQKAATPRKPKPRSEAPADSGESPLASSVGHPSADELAVEAREALRKIDAARLSDLGWKYLDQAQTLLSAIRDAGQAVGRG